MYIRSPLKYPGAKGRHINQIAPLIPEFNEYREPFLGGASIYLYVRQKYGGSRKYWINDLYYPLYNFWKQTQQNIDDMIDDILKWKKNCINGHQLQQLLKINGYKFDDIEKGAAYFLWNSVSYAGLPRGCDENGFKKLTEERINSLRDLSNILRRTHITNLDYSKLIETPPSDGVDENDVFIMEDPPYFDIKWPELYGTKGKNMHASFDHYKFSKVMKNCKYRFLITYDDSEFIREKFEWANITSWNPLYTLGKIRTGNEIFISNYELPKIRNGSRNGNENNIVKTKQFTLEDSWG